MVSQIQLGNIFQQNGRTVVGGGQSAFDVESIVNSLVEARRQPAVLLETQNETVGRQQAALADLRSLFSRFRSAVDVLRNPPGVQNAAQNIFQYRTATLTANTSVAANNYLTATVQPGASVQTFSIDSVNQLARETRQQSDDFFLLDATSASAVAAVATPGQFTAGSFNVRRLTGGSTTITLNAGDSLQTVANRFNEVRNDTGIQATVLKVADGVPNNTFRLIFTATNTGLNTAFDLEDSGIVTADPSGVLSNVNFNTTQAALNSQFTIDGVTIERQTNAINDVIGGITFNLRQPTPPLTSITLDIDPDTEIVAGAITQFADVYNEFRLFAARQSEVGEDGLPTEDAVLSNNSTLRNIISTIGAEITGVVNGIIGSNPSRLADVGITFQDFQGDEENPFTRNILVIETDRLSSELAANFDGVAGLFEFQLQSDNANLAVFRRANSLDVTDLTLNIDRTNDIYQASYTDDNGILQTIDLEFTPVASTGGVNLQGQNGTVLEGLELIFAQAGDATFDVHFSQGIADRIFNSIDNILDEEQGLLTNEENRLEEVVTDNEEEIVDIDEFLLRFRDQLVEQYSQLEAALSRANNLLALLDAQAGARNA